MQIDECVFDENANTPSDGVYPQRVCYTTIIPLDKWYNSGIIILNKYREVALWKNYQQRFLS